MLGVHDALATTRPHEAGELSLALDQRLVAQVMPIDPQQIERIEHGFALTAQELVELAHTILVQAHDFAIENRTLHGQLRHNSPEGLEAEILQLAGDELALAVLEVGDSAEAVMLQFKDVVGMVERLLNEPEAHGPDARQHTSIVSLAFRLQPSGDAWF